MPGLFDKDHPIVENTEILPGNMMPSADELALINTKNVVLGKSKQWCQVMFDNIGSAQKGAHSAQNILNLHGVPTIYKNNWGLIKLSSPLPGTIDKETLSKLRIMLNPTGDNTILNSAYILSGTQLYFFTNTLTPKIELIRDLNKESYLWSFLNSEAAPLDTFVSQEKVERDQANLAISASQPAISYFFRLPEVKFQSLEDKYGKMAAFTELRAAVPETPSAEGRCSMM